MRLPRTHPWRKQPPLPSTNNHTRKLSTESDSTLSNRDGISSEKDTQAYFSSLIRNFDDGDNDSLSSFEGIRVNSNNDDDDYDTATSESDCTGSAFDAKRTFWTQLLTEQEGETPLGIAALEEDQVESSSRTRATMIGQEIEKTWSSGSPLSLSSAFRHNDAIASQPTDDHLTFSTKTDTRGLDKAPIEIKETITMEYTSPRRQSNGRRSFGDITNSARSNSATSIDSACISNKNNMDTNGKNPTNKSNDEKAPWVTLKKLDESVQETKEIIVSQAAPLPSHDATKRFQKDQSKKRFQNRKIEKVRPNPDDEKKFRWAYEKWNQAGLMQNVSSPRYRNNGYSSPQTQTNKIIRSVPPLSEKGTISGSASLDTLSRSSTISGSEMSKVRASTANLHINNGQNVKTASSGDIAESDDHNGFKQILNMWRDQSNEKKSRHCEKKGEELKDQSEVNDANRVKTSNNNPKNEAQSTISQPLTELSAISCISTELVPYNGRRNDDDLSNQLIESGSYVESDLYTEDYAHGGDRALVIVQNKDSTYDVMVGESLGAGEHLMIRNLESVTGGSDNDLIDDGFCDCSRSIFSGSDDLISFFLPQMGMACTCGGLQKGLINPEDPFAIENVLRPWQCKFLKSFGIHRGEQLVKARHRSADIMARALRQWRKKEDMIPFKTSSCGMAIHIWAKTCKAYVRSIRKQMLAGKNLLERNSGGLMDELSQFLRGLPSAPPKRIAAESLYNIEPESQVEV